MGKYPRLNNLAEKRPEPWRFPCNLKNTRGMTPLNILIEKQMAYYPNINTNDRMINEEITFLLMEKSSFVDDIGLSHFHVACTMTDSSLAESLLGKINDINHSVHLDSPIWPGYTALHFAAHCNLNIFQLLVIKGADIRVKNSDGVSLFDLCLSKLETETICDMLKSNSSWRNITLSDGKTKLLDIISAIRHLSMTRSSISISDIPNVNIKVQSDLDLWPGYTILHLAVILLDDDNCCSVLEEQFLKKGADICAQHSKGWTPLHLAVRLKRPKNIIDLMLKYHHEVTNPIDEEGLSHLHIICSEYGNNSKKLIEKLLATGTDVNAIYSGKTLSSGIHKKSTPLHVALYCHNYEAAKLLLAHGADIYAKDGNNITPLHYLLDNFIPKSILEVLLATPDLQKNLYQITGLDLLHIACYSADMVLVEKILDSGANIDQKLICKDQKCYTKFENFTPLQFAVERHNFEITNLLISRGANLFLDIPPFLDSYSEYYEYKYQLGTLIGRDHSLGIDTAITLKRFEKELNITPLHAACYNIDVDMVKNLLSEHVDVNARIVHNSPIWPGYTPIHVLMINSDRKYKDQDKFNVILELLINDGANITATNAEPYSLLHIAYLQLYQNRVTLSRVSALLKNHKNFNLNPTSIEGFSHFYVACALNDAAVVKKFLEHGANVNERSDVFFNLYPSPLHVSMSEWPFRNKYSLLPLKTVNLLLEYGADVSVENNQGQTPLHLAAKLTSSDREILIEKIVEKMINCGCDVNAKNIYGESAFELILKNSCSKREFEIFFKYIDYLNIFNPITEEGFIGWIFTNNNLFKMILNIIQERPQLVTTDEMDRTIIHNIASSAKLSEMFSKDFFLDLMMILNIIKKRLQLVTTDGMDDTIIHKIASSPELSNMFHKDSSLDLEMISNIIKKRLWLFTTDEVDRAIMHNIAYPIDLSNTFSENFFLDLEMILNIIKKRLQYVTTNEMDRTIIHNIASSTELSNMFSKDFFLHLAEIAGCNLDDQDKQGRTALHVASNLQYSRVVSLLLERGADPNIIDASGNIALHYAARSENKEVVSALLENGADPDVNDASGNAALHIAVKRKNIKTVSALLEGGADVDIIDAKGRTALHIVARNPFDDYEASANIATLLLAYGADINIKDANDKNAYMCDDYLSQEVRNIFNYHIAILKHSGFDISKLIEDTDNRYSHFWTLSCWNRSCIVEQQLEKMKSLRIEPYSHSLYDYFPKVETMDDDPYTSRAECHAIVKFLKCNHENFEKNFSKMMPVVMLLRRKITKILKSFDQSRAKCRISLDKIAGFPIPDLCFQAIMDHFDDRQTLENLIAATDVL